jgi:hypothetical protein
LLFIHTASRIVTIIGRAVVRNGWSIAGFI